MSMHLHGAALRTAGDQETVRWINFCWCSEFVLSSLMYHVTVSCRKWSRVSSVPLISPPSVSRTNRRRYFWLSVTTWERTPRPFVDLLHDNRYTTSVPLPPLWDRAAERSNVFRNVFAKSGLCNTHARFLCDFEALWYLNRCGQSERASVPSWPQRALPAPKANTQPEQSQSVPSQSTQCVLCSDESESRTARVLILI